MTREERNTKLKHLITCLKCEVSGKVCDDNCPVQYEAGNMEEIIENLEAISKALEQEPCEDEYIKVPKKALKYRTKGMVAYNAEWLKNHFDIERAVICGAQEPCEDVITRILKRMWNCRGNHATSIDKVKMEQIIRDELPPVNSQPNTDVLDKIRSEIEKLQKMCGKNDLNLVAQYSAFGMVLDILDKYKAESGM